ncbi:hypothetical protein AB0C77_04425 [Streptomyces sp. NPDC048629]|uniref:hypothetical protein n=1 Tax=Streptomyces sp. NPDC048629 TaxID=3154824 RepID=UPI0034316C55
MSSRPQNLPRLAHGAGRARPLRAVPSDVTPGDVTALRAETQVAALGVTSWPPYGTAEWLQLSPKDPRCYAATLEAAELHRRAEVERLRLESLMDNDPESWWCEVTADANAHAASIARSIAARRTAEEIRAARAKADARPPHQLRATPGWPPIRIPGRPGRYLVFGQEATA